MDDLTFFYELPIPKGQDLDPGWVWAIDGTPVDLTGASARMQLRRTLASTEVLQELSTADGTIVLGGAAGTIQLALPGATTANLSGEGVYDLVITFASGKVKRLMSGRFVVLDGVTR